MGFKNIRSFHDRINQLFHISLALPLLPIGFIFLESNHNSWQPSMPNDTLIILSTLIPAVLIAIFSYLHYRKALNGIRNEPSLKFQFDALFKEYRRNYLMNLLASAILAVGYYFTASPYLIGTYLLLLFSLSLLRPYYERYNRDLMLEGKTAKEVRKMTLEFDEGLE